MLPWCKARLLAPSIILYYQTSFFFLIVLGFLVKSEVNSIAQKSMRPWLPFVVAGGVVAGEGGGLLSSGFLLNFLASMLVQESISLHDSSLASMASIYSMLFIPFIIIGIISLPIGLVLLGVGLNKKKNMKRNEV